MPIAEMPKCSKCQCYWAMNDIEDYERWRTCECDCHPHWITQQTKCAICQHEWVAVYPEDKIPGGLECPACEHMTGSDNG